MATKLQIANDALMEINESPIQSLDAETGAARTVSAALDGVIRNVVGDYNWPIKRTVRKLTPSTSYVMQDSSYDNAFEIPSDCDQITSVKDDIGYAGYRYTLRDNHILADMDFVFLHYNKEATEVVDFPNYLATALTFALAARIAGPIAGESEGEKASRRTTATRYINKAKKIASREGPSQTYISDDTSQFMEAHRSYGRI